MTFITAFLEKCSNKRCHEIEQTLQFLSEKYVEINLIQQYFYFKKMYFCRMI